MHDPLVITRLVAERLSVTPAAIISPSRSSDLVYARRLISRLLRDEGYILVAIAEALNKADHSAVVYYLRRQRLIETRFNADLEAVRAELEEIDQAKKRTPDDLVITNLETLVSGPESVNSAAEAIEKLEAVVAWLKAVRG